MATIIYATGFEYGVSAPVTNGAGLFNTVTGSPSIQSSVKNNGSYAMRAYTASSTTAFVGITVSNTIICGSFKFLWHTAPSSAIAIFRSYLNGTNSSLKIFFDPADKKLYGVIGSNGNKTAALTVDTWYTVDFRFDVSTTTEKLDLRLDGTPVTQLTTAGTVDNIIEIAWGVLSNATGDLYYDDVILSATTGDYPLDGMKVLGLSPDADGTHSGGTNSIEDQSGTDIVSPGYTTAHDLVNSVPIGDATAYIKQSATGANYAELLFADTTESSIFAAFAYLAYKSSGTSANTGACIIIDEDATQTTLWGNPTTRADYSESSNFYKRVKLPNPSGGWDTSAVNALSARCGYSNDVSPVPYWLDLMVEIVCGLSTVLVVDNLTQAQTIDNIALTQHQVLVVDNLTQVQTIDNIALTQHQVLVVDNLTQVQTIDNVIVTYIEPAIDLVVADLIQAQTIDNITLIQHQVLTITGLTQNQLIDNVSLIQHQVLSIDNLSQDQSVNNVLLIQHQILNVNDLIQNQSIDNVSLTQHQVLSINDLTQVQSIDNVALAQHQILSIDNLTQVQSIDNVSLTQHQILNINDLIQGQLIDNVSLMQHQILEIENLYQDQIIDSIVLVYHEIDTIILDIDDLSQNQLIDNISLIQHQVLSIDALSQNQLIDNVSLTQHQILNASNLIQDQSIDNISLTQHQVLNISNLSQNQNIDNVSLIPHGIGNIYYVAKNGNNSNSGAIDHPWLTIAKANSTISSGDTVYIRGGTYEEQVILTRSGTANSLTKFLAYPDETPIIDGSNLNISNWSSMLELRGNYIQTSGFEVCYSDYIGIELSGHHDVVSYCYSHENNETGILARGDYSIIEYCRCWRVALNNFQGAQRGGGWASAISAARDNVDGLTYGAILRNNVSWENWGEGVSCFESSHCILENNVSHDNYSTNIYISDSTNGLCQRNFCYNTPNNSYMTNGSDRYGGAGVGIMMGDEVHDPSSSDNIIINNIVYGCVDNFYWWANGQNDGLINDIIAYNTFVNCTTGSNVIIDSGAHSNTIFKNNLIVQEGSRPISEIVSNSGLIKGHNGWSKTPNSGASGTGDVVGDPKLAKTETVYDISWYRIQYNSPDLDHAEVLSEVTTDFYSYSRSNFPEIGALESIPLSIDNLEQSQVLDSVLLTYHESGNVVLTIDDLHQVQSIDNVSLIQHQILSVNDLYQNQIIESLTLVYHEFGVVILSIDDIYQNQIIDTVSLIQHQVLSIDDIDQNQSIDNVSLIQHQVLSINDLYQNQLIDSVILVLNESETISLVIQNVYQSQKIDKITLITAWVQLSLIDRIFDLRLDSRSLILDLEDRSNDLTIRERSDDLTLQKRSITLIMENYDGRSTKRS